MSYTESQSRENEGKKKGKSESRHDRRFGKVFMIEIEKINHKSYFGECLNINTKAIKEYMDKEK